jgi:hypothetical protein
VTTWHYTGALPTRERDPWVYALNWGGTPDGTLVIHVFDGGPEGLLILNPGDVLTRDEGGRMQKIPGKARPRKGRRRTDRHSGETS